MKTPTKEQVGAAMRFYDQSNPRRDSSKVFVIDAAGRQLAPCHHAIARKLLKAGKATVASRQPFTIRLVREAEPRGVAG